jgi:hypothetical protein
MVSEQPKKSKPSTHTPHPETQNPRGKTPGSESSEAQGTTQDVRTQHDQDGNVEQQRR